MRTCRQFRKICKICRNITDPEFNNSYTNKLAPDQWVIAEESICPMSTDFKISFNYAKVPKNLKNSLYKIKRYMQSKCVTHFIFWPVGNYRDNNILNTMRLCIKYNN